MFSDINFEKYRIDKKSESILFKNEEMKKKIKNAEEKLRKPLEKVKFIDSILNEINSLELTGFFGQVKEANKKDMEKWTNNIFTCLSISVRESISKENTKKWITDGPENTILERIEDTAFIMVKSGLTTSQLRNIFSEIRKIEASLTATEDKKTIKPEITMLKPLSAYLEKRVGNYGAEILRRHVIEPAVDTILENDSEIGKRFKNFIKLLEAILAYHKSFGGN